ncbi:unnamed protein product [Gongylonema pulchrum]|uniref:Flagellar export protein FliJ n=1 Tax=Gongylonema pulchrum TaxID=637853 RepID=A0A183DKN5_9BILA|nr:unnamed protein product [Gongylonema pulchrum]
MGISVQVQMWQEETVELIQTIEEKLGSVKTIEEREEVKKTVEEVMQRFPEQNQRLEEAERISRYTEGEEVLEKIMIARKKQREIEERLVQLHERIQIDERVSYRETMTCVKKLKQKEGFAVV